MSKSKDNKRIADVFSIESERHSLAGLCRHPDIIYQIDSWFSDKDYYQEIHKTIYSVIRNILFNKRPLDKVLVAQEIANLGIKFNQDISIFDYVESLFLISIGKEAAFDSFKEVVKLRVRRDLIDGARRMAQFAQTSGELKVGEIVSGTDKIYGELIGGLRNRVEEKVHDIFADVEEKVEEIGNNPPSDDKYMMGPFETVNKIFGSLSRPGNITVIGARSGIGKSSLAMFYQCHLAQRYQIPILNLDFGEMSPEELQFRAVCMFTKGEVPLNAIENGDFRKNPEWERKVRDVWKIIKKVKFYYEDVSSMGPQEIISLIRRYSLSVFGRDNNFIVNYDYIKPFDTSDFNTPEWKQMGHFIQDIKSFINNEINVPFWASLQLNRSGITTNKGAAQVDDSENSFSISDRILQQCSHAFIMRSKLNDEIAEEGGLKFGNSKLICVKHRHLGKDYSGAIKPVEVKKGVFKRNYVNLLSSSFYFEDKGDLRQMAEELKEKHDISDGDIEDVDI